MGTQTEKISSMDLVPIKRDPIQQLDDGIETAIAIWDCSNSQSLAFD